ncbi:MAG: hypothetical protein ACO1NS_05595 [Daejeonella sp.]
MSTAKAIFLLFIVVFAIGTAIANPFYMVQKTEQCCSENTESKKCHKPAQEEKKSCSRDYCNPFQSCSTTPVLVAQAIKFHGFHLSLVKQYPNPEAGSISEFSSKHWQPPKV